MTTTWNKPYTTRDGGKSWLGDCARMSLAVKVSGDNTTWSVAERYSDGLRQLATGDADSVEAAQDAAASAATTIYEQREATRRENRPEMVSCDCGHSCPVSARMTTSRGTSCPNCYDRMSE